ncbi:hypothetical protein ACWEQ1_35595 [Streptomyces nodosus]
MESTFNDLPVEIENGHVPFGLGPAVGQVGLERVEFAGELSLEAHDHVLPAGGADVSLHGVPSPAQVVGNASQTHALGEEVVDKGMVGAGPFGELAGRVIQLGLVTGCRPGGRLPCGLGF